MKLGLVLAAVGAVVLLRRKRKYVLVAQQEPEGPKVTGTNVYMSDAQQRDYEYGEYSWPSAPVVFGFVRNEVNARLHNAE